jgi:hypothetical protein
MSAADNLIKEFCQSIGMQPMGFDENKQRSLSFDEKVVVTFLNDEADVITALVFVAHLGKPENMRVLLEQNFLAEAHGGARFALEPRSDRVVMTRQWDGVKTTVPQFSDDLEKFVNSAIKSQDFFNSGGIVDTPADGEKIDSLAAAYQNV